MAMLRPSTSVFILYISFAFSLNPSLSSAPSPPPPTGPEESCNGVFLRYTLISRKKEYPILKNASAQPYAFSSTATVLNTMDHDLKAWTIFIGFQYEEILVSASGAVVLDGSDFPAHVGNGTSLMGYPQIDLMNAIDTAGDLDQIQAKIEMKGTQFGVREPGTPMPKTIKLTNEGFLCPAPTQQGSEMYVCCIPDPKKKTNVTEINKFLPRQNGDLKIYYDVLQVYSNNYLTQVTLDNNHPLGRLDNWNLTWEWMRGEFIQNMKGAYTLMHDPTDCIYGAAGNYYSEMDFSQVMNCEKKPIIVDLPPEREKDDRVGNVPYCCKNGTLLPNTMDSTKSKAVFQVQVFKIPPDNNNRTAIHPPQNWKISGFLNPNYLCGPPIRVSPTLFPDSGGLMSRTTAVATWQIVCNITKPKQNTAKCCVSYSAFYNESVIPCNTCACGCPKNDVSNCSPNTQAMLLPPEALLVPYENRTAKAKAWAKIKHLKVPNPMPCGDNCGVTINWHILSDYRKGWTARITLFNWGSYTFKDWSAAVKLDKVYKGYENAYSFNGTRLAEFNNQTIFFQGMPGLTWLNPMTDIKDPNVPGKTQSVVSFTKRETPGIDIVKGDGFPTKVYFNGEECTLPDRLPTSAAMRIRVSIQFIVFIAVGVVLVLLADKL